MKTIEFQTQIQNGIITVPQQLNLSNQYVKIAIFDMGKEDKEVLHIELDHQLKRYFTTSSIQNYLEEQLQLLLMEQVKSSIDNQITESGIDNDLILEQSREQAWDSYKQHFLKNVKTE